MASNATEPTVDPAFETAASALRADLAARGVPADELPEPVMLALAVVIERIAGLERWLARLEDRTAGLRRVGPVPTPSRFLRPALDAARDQIQERLVEAAREVTRRVRDESRQVPADSPPEAPRFRHDCSDCVFLGRSADGTRDLYWCRRFGQLKSRYGDNRGEYNGCLSSWAREEVFVPYPHLAEAHRRAVARGLIDGAGEGG